MALIRGSKIERRLVVVAVLTLGVTSFGLPAADASAESPLVAYDHYTYVRQVGMDRTGVLHFAQGCGADDCSGNVGRIMSVYRLTPDGASLRFAASTEEGLGDADWPFAFDCTNRLHIQLDISQIWRVEGGPFAKVFQTDPNTPNWDKYMHSFDFDCQGALGRPGSLYYLGNEGTLYRVDGVNATKVDLIGLEGYPEHLAFSGEWTYVSAGGILYRVEPDGRAVALREMGTGFRSFAFEPSGRLFFSNPNWIGVYTDAPFAPTFTTLLDHAGEVISPPITRSTDMRDPWPCCVAERGWIFAVDSTTQAVLHFELGGGIVPGLDPGAVLRICESPGTLGCHVTAAFGPGEHRFTLAPGTYRADFSGWESLDTWFWVQMVSELES